MQRLSLISSILTTALLLSGCGGGSTSSDASGDLTVIPQDDVVVVPQTDTPVVPQTDTSVVPQDNTTVVESKVDLSWSAPTTRTDGTPLSPSELEGYRIYLGTSPDNLVLQEELLGISSTEISLIISAPGIYYFAVTAYDADGLESAFSEVVSKEVG